MAITHSPAHSANENCSDLSAAFPSTGFINADTTSLTIAYSEGIVALSLPIIDLFSIFIAKGFIKAIETENIIIQRILMTALTVNIRLIQLRAIIL